MKTLLTAFRAAIKNKDAQKAVTLLKQPLDKDSATAVNLLREDGALRFARYNFESTTLITVVERIRDEIGEVAEDHPAKYLESVIALGAIAPAVKSKLRRLSTDITPFFFKRYLVAVEHLFRRLLQPGHDPHRPPWQDFTLEELADGFSYYFSLLQENHSPTVHHINHLPLSRSGLEHMLDNLAEFARIIRFREAELLAAHFPYRVTTNGSITSVAAINPELEKSIRWGYIREGDQRHADRLKLNEEELPSLKDLAMQFISSLGDRMCQIVGGSQPRVRIEIPLAVELAQVFTGNFVFREEAALVQDTMKTLFLRLEDLHSAKIYKSVTLHQLLKFRRFCAFIAFAQDEFCRRRNLLNTPIHFRSLITHLTRDEAHTVVQTFCGAEHPEEVLEVLCNTKSAVKVFDLQRTPVLNVADQYLIPPAVIANTSITHNALQATRFRFDDASTVDPVTDALKATFTEVGIPTSSRIEYTLKGASGELDLLAMLDNHLFAFECKNSLTPCSTHELRQSYGYIIKAFKQLSRFRSMLSIPEFVGWLRKKTGFALPDRPLITTCVVMGNRMFNGYQADGHCVRNIHELNNVIAEGVVRTAFPLNAEDPLGPKVHFETPLWKGEKLTSLDLVDYLGDRALYQMAFEAMFEYDQIIAFGDRQLVFRSFALDAMDFRDKLRQHPRTSIKESIQKRQGAEESKAPGDTNGAH